MVLICIGSGMGCVSLSAQRCHEVVKNLCEYRALNCGERNQELCREALDEELQCVATKNVDSKTYYQCLDEVVKTEQCLVVLPETCYAAFANKQDVK